MRRGIRISLLSAGLATAPLALHVGGPVRVQAAASTVSGAAVQVASPAVQGAQASHRMLVGREFGSAGPSSGYVYPGTETADPSVAVTATRYVTAVNSHIYTQGLTNVSHIGEPLGDANLHTLFGVAATDEVIQPHVVYDKAAHRFFLSALEVDRDSAGAPAASRVWLAYSAGGVTWTRAPLTALSAAILYDQPIIAADSDKVVVAFTARPIGSGTGHGEIKVIQKSDLVRSGVLHQVTLTGPAVPAELAPAVTVTSSGTLWLVADQQTRVALVALTGRPDQGNVAAHDFAVPVTAIVRPRAPVQPFGKTVAIPPPRFVTAMWRSGTLWTTTVDGCIPAGSTMPRSCLRLLAFSAPDPPAAPAVLHDFDIGDANMDYFAPAVASDGYGDIVIAASESNAYTDPTNVWFSERPPFTAVTGIINGFQTQYQEYIGPDWGGYSAVAVDPAEPASVWTSTQEVWMNIGSPGWQTYGMEVLATTPTSWPGSTPAIGTRDNQTASLIYRRADGKLEWLESGGLCPDCWSKTEYFTPTGGATAAPAFTPDIDFGDEWLFTRRSDHHIWWLEQLSGGASRDLGGYATSAPTTMTGGRCTVDLLIRGADGAVHLKSPLRTWPNWSRWHSLGGSVAPGTQPGAVAYGNNHQAVFIRGTDNRVHWKHSNDCGATWSRWSSLGGQTLSNPAASSEKNGTIDLFRRGIDNALYTRHFNGSTWGRWTNLGGILSSGPAAAIPRIMTSQTTSAPWGTEVIAVGADQHLWEDLKPAGGRWTGWRLLYSQAPTSW
jgi:hypothetical protein